MSVTLPGLIDVHRHHRDLDQSAKEDLVSGSCSALASGITHGFLMPNTKPEILDFSQLSNYRDRAVGRIYSDASFIFGTTGKNLDEFQKVRNSVEALKIYRNETTGSMAVTDPKVVEAIFKAWIPSKPIMTHSEGEDLVQEMVGFAVKYRRWVHFCHVSLAEEVAIIREAKAQNFPISAEVCPHHLAFSTEDVERLGGYGLMKPPLSSKEDMASLWEGVYDGTIDMIATDHAPHTRQEKTRENPAWGVICEPTLPIVWRLFHEKGFSLARLTEMMHDNPIKVFGLPSDERTRVIFDPDPEYGLTPGTLKSKAGYSPFVWTRARGRIERIYLRGELAYKDGEFIGEPKGLVI